MAISRYRWLRLGSAIANCGLGQLSYVHATPKPGQALEQTVGETRDNVNSASEGSPGPSSSSTRPSQGQGNSRRLAGTYENEHSDGVPGSGGAEDDIMGEEHPPFVAPQTGSSFEQAESTPYFLSATPTVRSEDVALLQSLIKSQYPHPRERYALGPLKGLPEQCSERSYTDLEEACLIRHFTENLASWVS